MLVKLLENDKFYKHQPTNIFWKALVSKNLCWNRYKIIKESKESNVIYQGFYISRLLCQQRIRQMNSHYEKIKIYVIADGCKSLKLFLKLVKKLINNNVRVLKTTIQNHQIIM